MSTLAKALLQHFFHDKGIVHQFCNPATHQLASPYYKFPVCWFTDKFPTVTAVHEYHTATRDLPNGSEYFVIVLFTNETESVYIKFEGSYTSYDGMKPKFVYEVFPKEVTVTQYHRK